MIGSGNNMRMTNQRRLILEKVKKAGTHPDAHEVYEMVRARMPRISLGTVYRNLETLSEQGLIKRIEAAGTQRRYDGQVEHHYHVRCSRCGRLDDVHIKPVTGLEQKAESSSGFKVDGHRLEFLGLCPECRKKGGGRKKKNSAGRKKTPRKT